MTLILEEHLNFSIHLSQPMGYGSIIWMAKRGDNFFYSGFGSCFNIVVVCMHKDLPRVWLGSWPLRMIPLNFELTNILINNIIYIKIGFLSTN